MTFEMFQFEKLSFNNKKNKIINKLSTIISNLCFSMVTLPFLSGLYFIFFNYIFKILIQTRIFFKSSELFNNSQSYVLARHLILFLFLFKIPKNSSSRFPGKFNGIVTVKWKCSSIYKRGNMKQWRHHSDGSLLENNRNRKRLRRKWFRDDDNTYICTTVVVVVVVVVQHKIRITFHSYKYKKNTPYR